MELSLRARTESDADFVQTLFSETIAPLLAATSPELRAATLQAQWSARESAYGRPEGTADRVVWLAERPVGRVIVRQEPDVDTLVDIAIEASARGQGIGAAVLELLKRESLEVGHPLMLHVRHGNRAAALYSRAGFVIVGASATELEMRFAGSARTAPTQRRLPAGYLPIRIGGSGLAAKITWADLGGSRLDAPFFSGATLSARRADAQGMIECALEELMAAPRPDDAVPLTGIVFHVSRCGSSLLVRSQQADPRTFAAAEVDPIDAVLTRLELAATSRVRALQAMVAAYARQRDQTTRRLVIKLDAWHLDCAALLCQAFPDVPKLVVTREPAAVLASHRARRGSHFVPGLPPARFLGIDPTSYEPHDLDLYGCRVLERLYSGARRLLGRAEVRFIDHAWLDTATLIAATRFVGCDVDARVEAEIERRRHEHAKERGVRFDADRDAARTAALPEAAIRQVRMTAQPGYDELLRGIAAHDAAIKSKITGSATQSMTR